MGNDNQRQDTPSAQMPAPAHDHRDQQTSKTKPISGEQTDDEAKLEEFGDRGLGVAAKE